ncbi:MAG TPA: response regulator [Candidatus Mediterraneibacter excrementigallinarum]|nr:response regulator [Candidatus Mediterraneibacter excrementigallinarum]
MYRVIVADDEPIALEHISSIIGKKCPQYEVVETAENGKEALEKVAGLHPDLLITDIKMPLMSGIELASEIHEKYPDTYTLIVSGYSDFEYARSAMQSGVCDYILKPVIPSAMAKSLEQIARKLSRNQYEKRSRIIQELCRNEECAPELLRQFFTYDSYYCAIIRRNGLPRRFVAGRAMETFSEVNESYTVYGRDEMEQLYIIPQVLLNGKNISAYIIGLSQKMHVDTDYMTIVYDRETCRREELQDHIKRLYHTLDAVSVVGMDQMIGLDGDSEAARLEYDQKAIREVMNNLEYMLKNQRIAQLKKEIRRLYIQWSYEKKPQMWMEYVTRQILFLLRKYEESSQPTSECEYMLEDAFFYATTSDELMNSLFDILFQYIKTTPANAKVDSPEFVDSIEQYIKTHLSENLSLKNVSREFGISQTYMGKLIRKYRNDSFSHYLTKVRMEKATSLMREKPQLYIKDIAEMVGYSDQLYFSRIFRSYMGMCPSDYMEGMEGA